jgi:hypothetical protein
MPLGAISPSWRSTRSQSTPPTPNDETSEQDEATEGGVA